MIISYYYLEKIWENSDEVFFEFGLLGEDGFDSFFPENNSIGIGTPMKWKLLVKNNVKEDKMILVKVKFLNSTMESPDDNKNIPSSERSIYEDLFKLSEDKQVIIPFNWSIYSLQKNNNIQIDMIMINDEIYEMKLVSNNNEFKIAFELWIFDNEAQDFIYVWESKGQKYSASLYHWFNII